MNEMGVISVSSPEAAQGSEFQAMSNNDRTHICEASGEWLQHSQTWQLHPCQDSWLKFQMVIYIYILIGQTQPWEFEPKVQEF